MPRYLASASIVAAVFAAGCASHHAQPAADLHGKLVVTGSSTIAPVVAEIARRFEEAHPGVRIDVQTGGSSRGIADVRSGAADIGMVSRALKPDEADLHVELLARDGVCLILQRDNPVTALTDEQVVAIYTDQINNWKEVGGNDEPIVVVHKAEGRATLEVFVEHFKVKNAAIRPDVVIGENLQGVKTVAGNPHAIGYVSIGTADYEARNGTPIKLLDAGGVAATPATVAAGRFPIARPLNLVTRAAPTGLTRAFIDFARSRDVHDLVEAQYFVPVPR